MNTHSQHDSHRPHPGNGRVAIAAQALLLLVAVSVLSSAAHAGWWPWSKDDETAPTSDAPVRLLNWPDLVPADYEPPPNPFDEMTEAELQKLYDGSEESEREFERLMKIITYAPTVEKLHGERVSLPGYVVPMEFDGQTRMSEFLLVPYFGACIHTPPPPANQVIHALSDEPIEIEDTYYPIILTGILSVETIVSDLAEAGYRIDVESVAPFPVEQQP